MMIMIMMDEDDDFNGGFDNDYHDDQDDYDDDFDDAYDDDFDYFNQHSQLSGFQVQPFALKSITYYWLLLFIVGIAFYCFKQVNLLP